MGVPIPGAGQLGFLIVLVGALFPDTSGILLLRHPAHRAQLPKLVPQPLRLLQTCHRVAIKAVCSSASHTLQPHKLPMLHAFANFKKVTLNCDGGIMWLPQQNTVLPQLFIP